MYGRERRRDPPLDPGVLRDGLTPGQLKALQTLEQFKWTLRFVRRPMFLDPVPVVFDRTGELGVIEPDGRQRVAGFKRATELRPAAGWRGITRICAGLVEVDLTRASRPRHDVVHRPSELRGITTWRPRFRAYREHGVAVSRRGACA